MTYIQPDSIVEFFTDFGIDPNYENTLYFPNIATKTAFFDNLPKVAVADNVTYVRNTKGSFKVELPAAAIIGAQYIRFRNRAFEHKWFYAFINSFEMINNVTTEVFFTIDYLMTWMGIFQLEQCMIERQHVVNDAIGANIADEGLTLGNYVVEEFEKPSINQPLWITVVFADGEGHLGDGRFGIYTGCSFHRFTNAEDANAFLKSKTSDAEKSKIVTIYMSPHFVSNMDQLGQGIVIRQVHSVTKPYSSIDGYVPKNNKLFCYPYKFLEVDNTEGSRAEYYYEYFNSNPPNTSSGVCNFAMWGIAAARAEVALIPEYYKFINTGLHLNWEEALAMRHFPQCAYAIDSYEAFLAQHNSNLPLTLGKTAMQGAISGLIAGSAGGLPGAAIGAAAGAATSIGANAASALMNNLIRPEQGVEMKGAQDTDIVAAEQRKDFHFYKKCITANYASMIDDYFTMYGYKIGNVGTPNMNARPVFTYVKTIGCNVSCNCPADHIKAIEDIFDKGIRFWNDHTKIGNYSVDNKPI